jgi:predicted transcriptional regulator
MNRVVKPAISVFRTPLNEVEEARLDEVADAEIDAGQFVPHEQIRTWLSKLAKGQKAAPPKA